MSNREDTSEVYDLAVREIKEAILKSQYQALRGVNSVQLSLYFGVGKYVSEHTRLNGWGTGAIDAISLRLRKELPGLRGFSATSLKQMRTFYEEWKDVVLKSSVITDDFGEGISSVTTDEIKTQYLVNADMQTLPVEGFMTIAFTHHYVILSKVKDMETRKFYIKMCAAEHLTVDALKAAIKKEEHKHIGQMPNNFSAVIDEAQLAKRAVLAFKDEYVLDFINVEEFGVRDIEEVDERIVENKIVQNIKNFIMTVGKDFAFLGNQYHVEALGHHGYIDLLFYNRELACLVAIELKTGPFKPIYLGELNTYLQILDDFVRKPNENQSIGIVLCKSADKAFAEYAIRDYSKPMGVATFKTLSDMPEHMKNVLPDLEELKKLL